MTSPVYQPTPPRRRRRSALKRQRRMILILLIVVAMLASSFAVVWHFTSRSVYKDVDGTKYYIVNENGTFVMQDADGNELPRTSHSNSYSTAYQTPLGTIVAVDLTTGQYSEVAKVSTSGQEDLEFSAYTGQFDILMYPMLEREVIKSIEVHNEIQTKVQDQVQTKKNSFTFQQMQRCTNAQCHKNEDGEYEQYLDLYDSFPKNAEGKLVCPKCGSLTERAPFTIKDFHGITFDENMFATLVLCTGYTTTYMRLDRDAVKNFGPAEYGLPAPGEAPKNYFIITDIYGNSHKVILGDKIPSDTGYYAQYEGHPDVYILKELEQTQYSYTLSQVLLTELESYITPTAVDTMTSTDYFDVTNFKLSTVGEITEEILQDPDADIAALLTEVISFDYIPIELRADKSNATIPYQGTGKYKSYAINDFKAESCLMALQNLAPTRTVKLFTPEENEEEALAYFLKTYGISYYLSYTHNVERDAKKNYAPSKWVDQRIWISPLQEKTATYFVYSEAYQMIVEIDRAQLEFLRWDNFTWVRTTLFNDSIAFMHKLELIVPGKLPVTFTVDNSESLKDWDPSKSNSSLPPDTHMKVSVGVQSVDLTAFKRFYITLLSSTLGGSASCTQADRDNFIAGSQNEANGYLTPDGKAPALVIKATYNTKATGSGTEFTHTAVFYNYGGGRQTMVVLDGAGDFYIPRSQVNTIIEQLSALYPLTDK